MEPTLRLEASEQIRQSEGREDASLSEPLSISTGRGVTGAGGGVFLLTELPQGLRENSWCQLWQTDRKTAVPVGLGRALKM